MIDRLKVQWDFIPAIIAVVFAFGDKPALSAVCMTLAWIMKREQSA